MTEEEAKQIEEEEKAKKTTGTEVVNGDVSKDRSDEKNDFVEGLCQMLGGMNAATSRYIVSSTQDTGNNQPVITLDA